MRIAIACHYAVQLLLELAQQDSLEPVSLPELAKARNLPTPFLRQVVKPLVRAGVIRSHRGDRGGYSLRRPANEITLRDIVEAVEGPLQVPKVGGNGRVDLSIWTELSDEWSRVLDKHPLADFWQDADLSVAAPGDQQSPAIAKREPTSA